MLPGIFLIKNGRRLAEERSQGILLDTIGDHLVSMNRFEEAFGPSQPHKDPKKAKQQRTVSLSNASTTKELRALLGAVPHWVKIAGKNGFSLSTERGKEVIEAISPERIDAIIAHLDLHWPGAGFVFDGDTNEESAPFTQASILLLVNEFTFPLGFYIFSPISGDQGTHRARPSRRKFWYAGDGERDARRRQGTTVRGLGRPRQ